MSTPAKKGTKSTAKKERFTKEEREAMKARAQESKAGKANDESAVLEAIAAMSPSDREIGERVHAIVRETAPELTPRTWYGMPAYAKDGKVLCFYRSAGKFKERYAMLGFQDNASLDDGSLWPVAYAITKLTKADEAKIRALVKRAVG